MENAEALSNKAEFLIITAHSGHEVHAAYISQLIQDGAKARGIGRGGRPAEYLAQKMRDGHAIIAFDDFGHVAGFSFLDIWEGGSFVANAGFIVAPEYRGLSLGKEIKVKAFELARDLFPDAKIFGITTTPAVMHMNNALGYVAVPYAELPQDEKYWAGCAKCPFYDVLVRANRKSCLCTAMLYDPAKAGQHGAILRDIEPVYVNQLSA